MPSFGQQAVVDAETPQAVLLSGLKSPHHTHCYARFMATELTTQSLVTTTEAASQIAAYFEDRGGCEGAGRIREAFPDIVDSRVELHPPRIVLKQMGSSRWTVRRMIEDGRLRGTKVGRDILVEQSSLDELFAKLDAERGGGADA
jgi:excisionase family DNA binding protein